MSRAQVLASRAPASGSRRNQLLRDDPGGLQVGRPVGLQSAAFQNELLQPAVSKIFVAAGGPTFTQQGTQPRAVDQTPNQHIWVVTHESMNTILIFLDAGDAMLRRRKHRHPGLFCLRGDRFRRRTRRLDGGASGFGFALGFGHLDHMEVVSRSLEKFAACTGSNV